jgi:ferric-dicitrate binding protein FerR (iron transport regulator)
MSRKAKTSQPAMSRRELVRARREARRRRGRTRAIALASGVVVVIALLLSWSAINAANRPGVPDMGNMHIDEGTKSPLGASSEPTAGPTTTHGADCRNAHRFQPRRRT